MNRKFVSTFSLVWLVLSIPCAALAAEYIPPLEQIKTDRPRVFLRPAATPFAPSLEQFRPLPEDTEFNQMLSKLKAQKHAAAEALVWLITGDTTAAKSAMSRMRAYNFSGGDTFHVYGRLFEYGLAYDWLYNYEGFTEEIKAEVRGKILPLAQRGLNNTYDHIFHNYIWMSAGGTVLWALATAGEDAKADDLFEKIRQRFNTGLFPGMEYLDGLPSEPLGYWSLYDFLPAAMAVLAAQSAFETDLTGKIEAEHGNWLERHYDNVIHSVLPSMRYLPWGDLQSGANGGVTHEMAGMMDAVAWALESSNGAHFSRWLADKRGLNRFYGETAIFYMLHSRILDTEPAEPPLSFVAGGAGQGGHFIARSGWDDGATVVGFGCKDHYGDHNHYDQGGFMIYRNALLAVDPPVYKRIRGPQQPTDVHNTLLIGGENQRTCRGQWFDTLEKFKENLTGGRNLETGDFLFYTEAGEWTAASAQFAQAYTPDAVSSCVRQLLFLRPDKVLVVDHLAAPEGKDLPEVQWLLQVPGSPNLEGPVASISKGNSWLRCTPVMPEGPEPIVESTSVNTKRISYGYNAGNTLSLVYLLEVGDGEITDAAAVVEATVTDEAVEVNLEGKKFIFESREPFEVAAAAIPGDADLNGKLDIFDLLTMLRVFAGTLTPTGQQAQVLDLDNSGGIDLADLKELLLLLAGSGPLAS